MVFKKEDFYELGIFELIQNVWCYSNTIAERGEQAWPFTYDYRRYCEEILQEKWPKGDELPPRDFVIEKLKKQEDEFYPGPIADSKKYLDFLHKVKKAMS